MTRSQFAMAAGAEEKWVENSLRLLRRKPRYTPAEAAWLGLVRLLNQDVGLSLARSAELAHEALSHDPHTPIAILGKTGLKNAGVAVDIARFHSTRAVSLSTALDLGGARRRGRSRRIVKKSDTESALTNAARYGVDIGLLEEGLKIPVAERMRLADENAAFVCALRQSARRPA